MSTFYSALKNLVDQYEKSMLPWIKALEGVTSNEACEVGGSAKGEWCITHDCPTPCPQEAARVQLGWDKYGAGRDPWLDEPLTDEEEKAFDTALAADRCLCFNECVCGKRNNK
jgi:hypothetical protein